MSGYRCSDSFTILGLWVLGLAVSHINESQLQTYESRTLFLMTSLKYHCILGLAEIKTASQRQNYAQKMQDTQVTKSLLTTNPGVTGSIPALSHAFVEIDHEIISTVILLPSADSFKKGCCQLQAKVCARITG